MPKRVDHEVRRAEMARAVLQIAARDGMGAVSIGAVARELGVSKGLVQHYFSDKPQLLACAATTLRLDLQRHVATAVAGVSEPLELLRQIVLAMVRLGREQPPTLLLAGHAFLASTGKDLTLRESYRTGNTVAERAIAELIRAAGGRPGAAEVNARILLALAGGLADALYVGQIDDQTAIDTVDVQLTTIIDPPSR